jgi:alkylated DNA repair dioxygenase AlkB
VANAFQLSLFGHDPPSFDGGFGSLERTLLPPDAWYDYAPGWARGHARLFETLRTSVHFRSERREMYERMVDVPRLYAVLPEDGALPPVLDEMQRALSKRYGQEFVRTSLAYYRDGSDSVAWHGDYVARNMAQALVATVSLGGPRRFLLRPKGGGTSRALMLGMGDLLVMGGSSQRTWQHSVPKVKHAEPRISVMFRPIWSDE